MTREIVVSEIDLDKIELEPEDFLPEDRYEKYDVVVDRIRAKKKRKFSKDGEYSSRRYIVP